MIVKYKSLKVEPFKQFAIIQTKEDNESIEHYTDMNGNLVCAICGEEAKNFEVIIRATVTVKSDGEIKKIKTDNIMLIKPIECFKCGSFEFIKTFTENEDFYGQRIN
jgi:hypothetical protein